MPLLMTKNDLIEVICKFKGHIVPNASIQKLEKDQIEEVTNICSRCNFSFIIKKDPDKSNCYLMSDID